MACASGSPLFSSDHNSTKDIIRGLDKFREAYEPWHGYLCVIICTFGLLTNFINVIVLTKRQMRTSINALLTGIACCDMGTMASYLIYIIHFLFADQLCNPYLYSYSWMLFLVCHVIFSVALHTTGLWLAVAMAFVRNMMLQRAMNGSKWLSSTNTWKICILVYACVFILCIPSVFGSDIIVDSTYFNETCMGDQWALASDYSRRYAVYTIGIPEHNCLVYTITLWLTGTVFKIIPCILLAFLIISLLWTIKKAERRRRALFESNSTNRARLRRQQQQESRGQQPAPLARSDRTTTMLVVILGLFLLTELPQGAVSIMTGIFVGDMRQYVYPNVGDVLDLLSLINSAVNFILYCAMSSKYRQVFWQVVLPRRAYVRWVLRPRSINARFAQAPPVAARVVMGESPLIRPELRVLNDMAEAAETMAVGDQESSIMDLYQVAASGRDGEFSLITESNPSILSASRPKVRARGLSIFSHFPKKRMSDCNLRRQVLTRAAILAAAPAMAGSASMESIARDSEVVPISREGTATVLSASRGSTSSARLASSDAEKSQAKQKKQRWLITCSCLCKCACRSGSGPEAAAIDGVQSPNRVDRSSIVAANVETVKGLVGVSTTENDLRRPLCPPMAIWRRCSDSSQMKEFVFV